MNMSKMTFLNASPMIIEATPEVARIPVMERSKTVAKIPAPASTNKASAVTSLGSRGTLRPDRVPTKPSQKNIQSNDLRAVQLKAKHLFEPRR